MLELLAYNLKEYETGYCFMNEDVRNNLEPLLSSCRTSFGAREVGYICRYRKALYFGSLGISLYLEFFCFLSFISFVLRKLT